MPSAPHPRPLLSSLSFARSGPGWDAVSDQGEQQRLREPVHVDAPHCSEHKGVTLSIPGSSAADGLASRRIIDETMSRTQFVVEAESPVPGPGAF